ncbi:MAG: serine hydrolase domain-containing protein [Burkholderiaceae bacterium]
MTLPSLASLPSFRAARRPLFTACLAIGASAALAQALPTASPESVGMSTERLNKITTTLQTEVKEKRLPGAVVMVARKGKLVYSQAVGDLNNASGGAMKTDSIFRIYSMTKPLVSTALMMLVEDGKVQLTDSVSKFLPSFKNPMVSVPTLDPVFHGVSFKLVAANREPTIQDLLRHTSGIAYGELTRNTLVRDAYIKAGVYKPSLDFDARDLPGPQMAEQLGKAPKNLNRPSSAA